MHINFKREDNIIEINDLKKNNIGKIDYSNIDVIIILNGFTEKVFKKEDYTDKINFYLHKDHLIENILATYRNLRENCDFNLRYDESGKFFTNEMEVKRKYKHKDGYISKVNRIKQHFSPIGLYYHLSRYGEDLWRPLIAGFVIIMLSTIYWSFNFVYHNRDIISFTLPSDFNLYRWLLDKDNWLHSLNRSLMDFIPLVSIDQSYK